MSISDYQIVFNSTAQFKEPLPVDEKGIVAFFAEVMKTVPELNDYERKKDEDEDEGYHLVERSQGRVVRQIRVQKKVITLAVGPSLGLQKGDEMARAIYPLISEHINPNSLLLDFLDVSFRFEFAYRGNHDALVLGEVFKNTPFDQVARGLPGALRSFQPSMSLSLSADHSVVMIVDIQTATSIREIESGSFDGDEIRLVCGVAKTCGLAGRSLEQIYADLYDTAVPFVETRIIPFLADRLREVTINTPTCAEPSDGQEAQ